MVIETKFNYKSICVDDILLYHYDNHNPRGTGLFLGKVVEIHQEYFVMDDIHSFDDGNCGSSIKMYKSQLSKLDGNIFLSYIFENKFTFHGIYRSNNVWEVIQRIKDQIPELFI